MTQLSDYWPPEAKQPITLATAFPWYAAELGRLQARVVQLETILRGMEWVYYLGDSRAFGTTVFECPYCREWKRDGHAADCTLAAALKEESDGAE